MTVSARRIITDPRVFGVIALAILCFTLWSYSQLGVWARDAIPHLRTWTGAGPTGEIYTIHIYLLAEGRWLHELLRPLLEHVDGTFAVFANLALFFFFVFVAAKRYASDVWYSFAFAALCVQSLPVAQQLAWPVVTLPSFFLLFAAAAVVSCTRVLPFYLIFGILFSGCIFHLYFMLPLLHLPLLSRSGYKANFKTLLTRIVPPWAGGAFLGWGVNMAIIYLFTLIDSGEGQIGLDIAEWRKVAGTESGEWDVTAWGITALTSIETLYHHVNALLTSNIWLIFATLGALMPVIFTDRRHWPAKILFATILLAPYIAVIPIGVVIQLRSAVPMAIGVAALLFLSQVSKSRWKGISMRVTLLLFSFGWALQTIDDKLYNAAVSDAWVDGLVRVAPMDPSLYKGVVLLNTTPSMIRAATRSIEEKLNLARGGSHIYDGLGWASTALAAGFGDAVMCGGAETHSSRPLLCNIVKLLYESYDKEGTGYVDPYGLYDVIGVFNGYLVVAIHRRFLSGSTAGTVEPAIEDMIGHSRLVARANFDIYLEGRNLYYVRHSCARADTGGGFFLHVFPNDLGDLSEERRRHGYEYDNLGHVAGVDAFMMDSCLLMVELPDYPISHIVTGQFGPYHVPGQSPMWSVEFTVKDETQENSLQSHAKGY